MNDFELILERRLREYTDPGIRPIDYLAEAQQIAASHRSRAGRWRWLVSLAAVMSGILAIVAAVWVWDSLPLGRSSDVESAQLAAQVEGLFEETHRCSASLADHEVVISYPATWASRQSDVANSCTAFGPLDIDGVAIAIGAVGGPPNIPSSTLSRTESSIGGYSAIRVEQAVTPEGSASADMELTYWVVLGSGQSGGPTLVATTRTTFSGDYGLNRLVLDRMMELLVIEPSP